jgi:hypothetical protein
MDSSMYPFVFFDSDPESETEGMWCIRLSESTSIDGFALPNEAIDYMREYFTPPNRYL